MNLIPIAPFIIQQTIAANTRASFVSRKFKNAVYLGKLGGTVAVNSQMLVQVSLYEIWTSAVVNNEIPAGNNFLSGGGQQAFITDDGESGLIEYQINRWTSSGGFLAFSINNTDNINAQPVYARVELFQAEGAMG